MSNKRIHHLNIEFDDSILAQQELDVWSRYFDEIERLSRRKHTKPMSASVPIKLGKAFAVLVTGKDLFLGIYDEKTDTISNHSDFLSIEYLKTATLHKLYQRVKNYNKNSQSEISFSDDNNIKDAPDIWAKYIAKVDIEENLEKQKRIEEAIEIINDPRADYEALSNIGIDTLPPHDPDSPSFNAK